MRILESGELGYGLLIEHDGYISPSDERNKPFVNEMNEKFNKGEYFVPEPFYLYAVLQKYDVQNKNGRYYPKDILYRENEKYQVLINEKRALGELDHPDTSIIQGDRVTHNIVETWWEGKTLMGKLELLMSPAFVRQGIISCLGDLVANYIRQGIKIGVSSRGVGSLREMGGKNIVQPDFELICWDIVTNPSTPGSWTFNKKEEAQPFLESKENKKPLLINKINNFLDKNGI